MGVAKDILIKLGELQFLTGFIVVENLIAPAVLGSNFLLSNSIVIDCEKIVVRKGNRCTPLLTENSKNGKMLVTVEQQTTVNKDRTEVPCNAYTFSEGKRELVPDGAYIYSPATLFWPTEDEATPAPTCVVDVQEGKIAVDMTPREE